MDDKVWVVSGSTGEYSDSRTWHVKAFLTEDAAKALCTKLRRWCSRHGVAAVNHSLRYSHYTKVRAAGCKLDPGFDCDYTGASYEVWSLEVEGLSDAFIENMGEDR